MDRMVLSKNWPGGIKYAGFRIFNGRVFRVDWDIPRSERAHEFQFAKAMMGRYADMHFEDPAWLAEYFHRGGTDISACVAEWIAKGYAVRPELGR